MADAHPAHLTADALGDFAEGLMPPADRREAEAHLALCADCRREAAALQGYLREVSGLETLKAPDRFLTRVHARIAKTSPWRRLLADLSSPRLLPVPLMGLAVLLVGVYFAFLSPRVAEQALSEAAPATAPPSQVVMAPPRPRSLSLSAPSPEAEAEKRAAPPVKAKRSGGAAAGNGNPSRPQENVAATGSAPVGTGDLALARANEPPPRASREEKAVGKGADVAADDPERKLAEAPGEWADKPSSAYIMGDADAAGSDPVRDQVASSPGPSDLLKDAPVPAPAPTATGARGALGAKPAKPVRAAKAESASGEASPPLAAAEAEAEDDGRERLLSEDGAGYAAPAGSPRKRSDVAAPPATTPKPWAPLGYTLKAKVGDAALRDGLQKLGIRILRRDDRGDRESARYELEVPATRVIDLEAYLGRLGTLTPSPQPLPGRKSGAPILLTLQIATP